MEEAPEMKRRQTGRGPKSMAAGEGQHRRRGAKREEDGMWGERHRRREANGKVDGRQGKVHNDVDDGIVVVLFFNFRLGNG
jgi:hypothetical protein